MEDKQRIILHIDMDAFFASVEILDNPSLKGNPVIVGGLGERGVVCTASYEARKYGVHSAMPGFIARKKCPMGIFMPIRINRYKEVSDKIFSIFKEYVPNIEPLSMDEAFLDLTGTKYTDGLNVALIIKQRVRKEIGLTLSVGISYNKFLAKLASDWNKPDGIKEIKREMIPDILLPLDISKIFGMGKKTVSKLNNMGIFIVEDLYHMDKEFFIEYMGKLGLEVYYRIRGIDNREVVPTRERKSVGKERTLKINTIEKTELIEYIKEFSIEISKILSNKNIKGKTVTLKYKTASFKNHTRSKTLTNYISTFEEIFYVSKELLDSEVLVEELRLIGISISSFDETVNKQLTFF